MHNRPLGPIVLFFALAFGLVFLWHQACEAARMGGGRSFGSKPSYQRSAPAPSKSAPSPQKNLNPAAPGMSPSPMGRWGGMLGGLVAGSLIGSLLFGGGHGAGGFGMLDLFLIGGGLFLLFRFLRARQMAAAPPGAGSGLSFDRSTGPVWGSGGYAPSTEDAAAGPAPALPPGFDAAHFLEGANAIFNRLQASWDKRDLADIRQFTSDEVYGEIRRQAEEDPDPSRTEVLLVTPRIIEARDENAQTIVTVLYDAMMRESGEKTAKQVRELWHFSRDRDQPQAFWLLEGIQQVEG